MATAPSFTFDPATHVYKVDGLPVPSVSQILREAGLVDYDGIPPAVLAYAADRGTAVHLACEYYDQDDLDPDSLDPQLAPYVAGWRRFRLEHPMRIVASEKMFLGKLHGLQFGMTVDRVVEIEGQDAILDIKCTREIEPSHAIQLAGYVIGLVPGGTPAKRLELYRRAVVQLKPDASYCFHEFKDPADGEIFAAALRIACWKLR
jgi:hypothetical protein